MPAIHTDRLAAITTLAIGSHEADSAKMCAMEAVAYIAGEPWSDAPACASPVIAAFVRRWNDALPSADRTRLLLPLVPEIVGTRTTGADDVTRAWMATDWLVRTHVPAWLTLAGMSDHAAALAGCDPVTSGEALRQAVPLCESAESAARSAARSAAEYAAMSAAWDAALSVAESVARHAAEHGTDLAPTVAMLQASAQDLVRRMCAVGRSPEEAS